MAAGLKIVAIFLAWVVVDVFYFAEAEGKMIRIDTHAHMVPPFYSELLISMGLTSGGLDIPKWNVSDHLAVMDDLNIELSVLSVSTPGARLTDDVEAGRKIARQLNEYGRMITFEYPERFQFFATLTLPDLEGSVAEAIYALDTLKAAGVALMASADGEYLGNSKLEPLMEVLDAREATVFVHPSSFGLAPVSNGGEGKRSKIPTFVLDFLLDTTRAASNLVLMNATGRYPNIKFLLAHAGGFLPFAAHRVSGAIAYITNETPDIFLEESKKFYVDTALSSSPSAFLSTLQFIPNKQITFGSDYPYAPLNVIRSATKGLDEYLLDDDLRHHINFHCANGLFRKHLSHWRSVWHRDASEQLL